MTFVVIFAIFVLTDLYPLSENPPSILEYLTWVWTLSIAIDEIRQVCLIQLLMSMRNANKIHIRYIFWNN